MNEQSVRPRSGSRARALGRLLVVALPIAAASAWAIRNGVGIADLQDLLQHHPAAPVLFLLLHVVFSLLFLPRAIMAMAAGLMFGVGWGLVWASAGSLAGAAGGFLLARYVGGGIIDEAERTRFGPVLRRVEAGGWRAVAMLRLIPVVPHAAANYLLGLTRVRFASYAVGSLLGQLPMTVAFVQFGAAGTQVMVGRPDWIQPTLVGFAALLVSAVLPKLAARRA
ncbi:TVP38/TMEM64 family protein [Azospirillum sp.]|uniref:TVP38/TMEM64 family protein n=1 Tax=Azospirillum sp. TaxID=34012 RepID=UPI003D749DCF